MNSSNGSYEHLQNDEHFEKFSQHPGNVEHFDQLVYEHAINEQLVALISKQSLNSA